MPTGVYEHADGAAERFTCAGGPAGWRYVSDRLDLTCDTGWRQLRVHVPGVLRGGVVGREALWVRGDEERQAEAVGFAGSSPGFVVATARTLGLAVGESVRVTRVPVDGPDPRAEVWSLAGVDRHEGLPVERYDVTDVLSGDTGTWYLAGDVVLAGPAVELAELDGPPDLRGAVG